MPKKNITAYFTSYERAEEAATKLRSIKASNINLIQWEGQGEGSREAESNVAEVPVTENAAWLGNTNVGSGFVSTNPVSMAAYSYAVGGDGDILRTGPTRRNILLEAVIDDRHYDKAIAIINDEGGSI